MNKIGRQQLHGPGIDLLENAKDEQPREIETHNSGPWRHYFDQTRLLLAERLIGFAALTLAPRHHPDTAALVDAAHHTATRRPADVNWRGST